MNVDVNGIAEVGPKILPRTDGDERSIPPGAAVSDHQRRPRSGRPSEGPWPTGPQPLPPPLPPRGRSKGTTRDEDQSIEAMKIREQNKDQQLN